MLTTFPRLLLKHATERASAPAMREKEYGIWQTHSWADMAALVEQIACGLHQAGLQRHEHIIVVGANRPRLYATMLAAQSLGAIPVPLYQDAVAAECVFPITNADVRFALVEDQEQVDKMLEVREKCPQLSHIFFDDPRGLRKYVENGLAGAGRADRRRQGLCHAAPRVFPGRGRQGPARRCGGDVLHLGHHRQPQGRGAHARHADRPRPGRRRIRQAEPQRRGAGLPAAGVDRPEHLQLRAVAGLRLRGELPRVGGHRHHRPEGNRPDLLLRAAAGV